MEWTFHCYLLFCHFRVREKNEKILIWVIIIYIYIYQLLSFLKKLLSGCKNIGKYDEKYHSGNFPIGRGKITFLCGRRTGQRISRHSSFGEQKTIPEKGFFCSRSREIRNNVRKIFGKSDSSSSGSGSSSSSSIVVVVL